ncbi:MAG TPA: S1 RNA-binding domain-containing protein, partial [Gammaproteobacteria bacterium]|nr:S1 RNA-binding domain-containing protein [Gammaproteobacteria bacterium]
VAENPKGSIVKGVVTAVEPKYATVKLIEGVEGQLKASEISLDKKIDDARTILKEGEEVEVKITALDRKKRTINLSIRAKESDDEAAAVEEYSPDSGTGAKLGDILKEHLDK